MLTTKLSNIFSIRFLFSSSVPSILKSNYHVNGMLENSNGNVLDKDVRIKFKDVQTNLQNIRKMIVEKKNVDSQNQLNQKYIQLYSLYQSLIKDNFTNNQWYINTVGWYNFTNLRKTLVLSLIDGKQIDQKLIDSLNWMKLQQNNKFNIYVSYFNSLDQALYKLQCFFNRLSINYTIEQIIKIQNIFGLNDIKNPYFYVQKLFFKTYTTQKIDLIIKGKYGKSKDLLNNILWLLQSYCLSINYNKSIVNRIQKQIIINFDSLQSQQIQRLMYIYEKTGRINNIIYEKYISQFIKVSVGNQSKSIVNIFKFLVYSEAKDKNAINKCISIIQSNSLKLTKQQLILCHVIHQYYKIKDRVHVFSDKYQKKLIKNCANNINQKTINRLLLKDYNKLSQNKSNNSYYCKCLICDKIPVIEAQQQQNIIHYADWKVYNLKECIVYKDHYFCSFHLQYCLFKEQKKQIFLVQSNTNKHLFIQQQRQIRQIQIRNTILRHYGFKIIQFPQKSKYQFFLVKNTKNKNTKAK